MPGENSSCRGKENHYLRREACISSPQRSKERIGSKELPENLLQGKMRGKKKKAKVIGFLQMRFKFQEKKKKGKSEQEEELDHRKKADS